MTDIANIAQRILDENNYKTPTTTITEYLIKNAVDYINLVAGTSISFTPSSGTATLTATNNEISVIKPLTALMVRAYHDRGPNVGIPGLGVTTVLADPQYTLFSKIVEMGIARLKVKQGVAFVVAEDTSGIE